MSADIVTFSDKKSDARAGRQEAMQKELEDRWQKIRACLTEVDPKVTEIACNSYWFGVKAGVHVATKAMGGAFR